MKTSDFFIMPKIPADALHRADGKYLRALIFLCQSPDVSFEVMASELKMSKDKLSDALEFWCEAGVLSKDDIPKRGSSPTALSPQPAQALAASRVYNPEYAAIVERAERMWGTMSRADLNALYGALNELHLPIEVILLLLRHMKDMGAQSMKSFERTAIAWANRGIFTASDAEKYMDSMKNADIFIKHACELLSLSHEKLSSSERKILAMWLESGYTDEIILEAKKRALPYTKDKSPIAYMNKILQKDAEISHKQKAHPQKQAIPEKESHDDDFSEMRRINLEYLQRLKDEEL